MIKRKKMKLKLRPAGIMVIAVLAILIITTVLISSCTIIDPCERDYTNCVHDCGEGILSGICKEKCTYDRNSCQEGKNNGK